MSSNDPLLTLTQIAKHFSLPESTMRYYSKRFSNFLPIQGEGRRRRYEPEALDIFALIIHEMQSGKNAHAIENILTQRMENEAAIIVPAYPVSHEQAPLQHLQANTLSQHEEQMGSNFAIKLLEQQTQAMQSIAQSLSILANQQEEMRKLAAEAHSASEENVRLRGEVGTLKELLHASESVHQDDLKQVHTWMSRLAGSYNKNLLMDTNRNAKKGS